MKINYLSYYGLKSGDRSFFRVKWILRLGELWVELR